LAFSALSAYGHVADYSVDVADCVDGQSGLKSAISSGSPRRFVGVRLMMLALASSLVNTALAASSLAMVPLKAHPSVRLLFPPLRLA